MKGWENKVLFEIYKDPYFEKLDISKIETEEHLKNIFSDCQHIKEFPFG
jgi:hypothetical protein